MDEATDGSVAWKRIVSVTESHSSSGVRNVVAEARLRDHSTSLVTRVTDDEIAKIRIGLSKGLERGDKALPSFEDYYPAQKHTILAVNRG